jgi:hypothetical protein
LHHSAWKELWYGSQILKAQVHQFETTNRNPSQKTPKTRRRGTSEPDDPSPDPGDSSEDIAKKENEDLEVNDEHNTSWHSQNGGTLFEPTRSTFGHRHAPAPLTQPVTVGWRSAG